jgi:probable F420-dependent oxidoreductase
VNRIEIRGRGMAFTAPRVGVLYRAADIGIPVVELAHALVDRGFDSLVVGEHTHIPVSRDTPYPAGGELPDEYRRMLDPYVALSFVAAETNLAIGSSVSLVAQHDPIALAKTVATLDFMSQGRFTLGVGYGWNREELASHGHQFGHRRAIVREHVALMRSLWRDEEAEFSGEHASLPRSWAWPKPVQQPSVPVLLGCLPNERNLAEIVGWADGWIPGGSNAGWLEQSLIPLRDRWSAAGRGKSGPIIWAMQNIVDDAELRDQLDRFRELGVAQVLFDVPTAPRDRILPLLDRCRDARCVAFG